MAGASPAMLSSCKRNTPRPDSYTASGNVNVILVPPPRVLSARMVPPCAAMIALTMASPRPLPLWEPERARSIRKKRSNMNGRSVGSMPLPVSFTEMLSHFVPLSATTTEACIAILPPGGV